MMILEPTTDRQAELLPTAIAPAAALGQLLLVHPFSAYPREIRLSELLPPDQDQLNAVLDRMDIGYAAS